MDGYASSTEYKDKKNTKAKVQSGPYSVFNEELGMANVTPKDGVPGNWINPTDNVVAKPKRKIKLSGEGHVQSKGCSAWTKNNKWAGRNGREPRIEAVEFRIM